MVKLETIQILKHLIRHNTSQFTIRELSKIRDINYKSAYEAVAKLEHEGAIIVTKKGNTKLCQFSKKITNSVYLAEKERLQDILKNSDMRVIYQDLQKIETQFIALLFGSYVKGKQHKHSDIDILIVSEQAEQIAQKIAWIPKNLHAVPISYNEFMQMLKSKEFTVVSEAVKNNVILFGIEDYYRLLEHAQ